MVVNDPEVEMLVKAIIDGLNMLPNQPRRWMSLHGDLSVNTNNIHKKDVKVKLAQLFDDYKEILQEARSLLKPIRPISDDIF